MSRINTFSRNFACIDTFNNDVVRIPIRAAIRTPRFVSSQDALVQTLDVIRVAASTAVHCDISLAQWFVTNRTVIVIHVKFFYRKCGYNTRVLYKPSLILYTYRIVSSKSIIKKIYTSGLHLSTSLAASFHVTVSVDVELPPSASCFPSTTAFDNKFLRCCKLKMASSSVPCTITL
jgi:hypothetical protein